MTQDGEEQLFSGTCGDFFQLPFLTLLNEVPISLWVNAKEGISGMSTLTDLEVKTIVKEDADWLINTTITTNYDEICFAVGGDSKYAEIVVANESGIVSQVRVDGKITSYGFTNIPVVFRPIFNNQVICAYLKDGMYSYYLLRLE